MYVFMHMSISKTYLLNYLENLLIFRYEMNVLFVLCCGQEVTYFFSFLSLQQKFHTSLLFYTSLSQAVKAGALLA